MTWGSPLVMVPVLSRAHDLGAAGRASREAAGLEEDAVFWRPLRCPTMMATGVARPRAQGQLDDQHRDAPGQGKGQILAQQEPDQGGHHRNGDDRRDKDARHPVSDLGDGGPWWRRRR